MIAASAPFIKSISSVSENLTPRSLKNEFGKNCFNSSLSIDYFPNEIDGTTTRYFEKKLGSFFFWLFTMGTLTILKERVELT